MSGQPFASVRLDTDNPFQTVIRLLDDCGHQVGYIAVNYRGLRAGEEVLAMADTILAALSSRIAT